MLHARFSDVLNRKACLAQIDRVANSSLLRGSQANCRLLRFLAEHALNSPSQPLKEFQLATEAMGRPPGFDPHYDSSVRVQVARLREKVAEYYDTAGSKDPILIEIPKGSYALSFQYRKVNENDPSELQTQADGETQTADKPRNIRQTLVLSIALACSVVVNVAVLVYGSLHSRAIAPAAATNKLVSPGPALEAFWGPFVRAPEQPFVVFRNMAFVGDDATGMRRFDPTRDSPNHAIHGFTGVGEVMGMLELSQLFDDLGSRFRTKREDLFTIDDARHNNLILVGSPATTVAISQIPGTTEFVFRRVNSGPNRFRWEIEDRHPRSGEPSVYPGGSMTDPVVTDYAIVALERGLDPSHWTLFLAGTSTISTEAAIDYVCNERLVGSLLARLHVDNGDHLKPFESLLQIRIANAVPVETTALDLREVKN